VAKDSSDMQGRSTFGVDEIGRKSIEIQKKFDQERTARTGGHV
jgi:hypothetical protein